MEIWTTVISILSGILITVLGAMLYRKGAHEREVQQDLMAIKDDVQKFKLYVAEHYQKSAPIQEFMRDVLEKLDRIQLSLANKADRKDV